MNKKIKKVFDGMDKETQDAIKTLINIMMVKKTKKEIFESSSVIFVSVLNKFLSKIFIGLTNL